MNRVKYGMEGMGDKETRLRILRGQMATYMKSESKKIGIDPRKIKNILSYSEDPDAIDKVERDMSGALEPWKRILGARRLKKSKRYAKSNATRIYALPKSSNRFIKKSWSEWD